MNAVTTTVQYCQTAMCIVDKNFADISVLLFMAIILGGVAIIMYIIAKYDN